MMHAVAVNRIAELDEDEVRCMVGGGKAVRVGVLSLTRLANCRTTPLIWQSCALPGESQVMFKDYFKNHKTRTEGLGLNQVLSDHQGEVCLGSSPQIRLGGSSKGVGQSIRERQARRVYRRACEAHFQATRGQVNPRLVQSLVRSFPVGVELIQQEDWPGLESLAKKDLTQVIQDKQKDLARRWKAQVSSLAGACAWVKKTSPPPPVLQQSDGTLVFGKQSGVEALFQDWQPIFCGDPDETLAVDKYRRLYDPFILQSDGFSVPELDVACQTGVQGGGGRFSGGHVHSCYCPCCCPSSALSVLP